MKGNMNTTAPTIFPSISSLANLDCIEEGHVTMYRTVEPRELIMQSWVGLNHEMNESSRLNEQDGWTIKDATWLWHSCMILLIWNLMVCKFKVNQKTNVFVDERWRLLYLVIWYQQVRLELLVTHSFWICAENLSIIQGVGCMFLREIDLVSTTKFNLWDWPHCLIEGGTYTCIGVGLLAELFLYIIILEWLQRTCGNKY